MKKILIIILIIALLIGGFFILKNFKNEDATTSNTIVEEKETIKYSDTKTGKFYSKFNNGRIYMEYEIGDTKIISATDGNTTYYESSIDGDVENIYIIDGTTLYKINHSSKTAKKTDDELPNNFAGIVIEETDVDMTSYKTGSRTIDEKTYDTEEWVIDAKPVIMCFEEDKLVYIISNNEEKETIVKVLKTSPTVDDNLLDISSNYEII